MTEIEKKHRRTVLIMGIALILCITGSFTLGRYPVSPGELLGVLCSRGMVFSSTSSRMGLASMRSNAGPDRTPWVAQA